MFPVGERINAYSHFVGAILSVLGLIALSILSYNTGDTYKFIGSVVYSLTLVFMYTSSTIYHGHKGLHKKKLQVLDHISIYLLIAGTYTPFLLVIMPFEKGKIMLSLMWGVAIIGTIWKLIFKDKFDFISTIIYLAMGWAVVFEAETLLNSFPKNGIIWLGVGGILYSLGAILYLLDGKLPRNHEIWHFFVLSASACQYVAVYAYLI